MSVTVITVITDALRIGGILRESQTPTPKQAEEARRQLNQMMAEWEHGDGIDIDWIEKTGNIDAVNVDAEFVGCITWNLAVRYCAFLGRQVPPNVAMKAAELWALASRVTRDHAEASLEHLPTPSRRGHYDIGAG